MVVTTIVVAYLIVTLSATGLAKIVNGHTARAAVAGELGLRPSSAAVVVASAVAAELTLSTLLALRFDTAAVLDVIAVLFVCFAAYHAYVAIRGRVPACACAGRLETKRAGAAAAVGTVSSCLVVAGIAVGAATLPQGIDGVGVVVCVAAWATPILVALAGAGIGALSRP